ncbi:APC family permease [Micromonospora siamensis]|uniref:Amino acid/polyamine/organocation transporter, APC superfamily n=1 Tax=Micromonospora siamensis TaxID=299152 RepID=A0A1C5GMI1_9ACTN|nr:APC family permease [Micromonospora siamensis]SCG34962.1 amino acid/polyamine/organocation transporter, APC superfamily [Micromonospora siamensis]
MDRLARRLGLADAVVIGLGSMLGAGVFVVFAPAAAAAGGGGLLLAVAVAGFVAFCNATSSARLAARYPESGGTYVYGRERLSPFAGFLAGWGFVVGKTASCAAMALTIGAYAWPGRAREVAAAAVVAVTAVNVRGIGRTALATRVLVTVTLTVLAVVAVTGAPHVAVDQLDGLARTGDRGVLTAAGLLFFAFAGYARIATLGEEVREPERTIPRAVPLALGIVLAIYLTLAVVALGVLGEQRLAAASAPLAEVVTAAGLPGLAWLVRAGATVAVVGVLLSLLAGVGRTTLAMARRRDLPGALAAVHPRYQVPHRAELAVAAVVIVVVALGDVRGAIGFSSCTVLVYYAIANASALTLGREPGRKLPVQLLAALGLVGCVALAVSLPVSSTLAGFAVLALGTAGYALRHRLRPTTR